MNFDDYGIFYAKPHYAIGHPEKLPADKLPPYGVSPASGDDKIFIAAGIPTVRLCDKKSFSILNTALDTVDVRSFPKMADGVITCYEPAMRLI